jgi:hypothetical protein
MKTISRLVLNLEPDQQKSPASARQRTHKSDGLIQLGLTMADDLPSPVPIKSLAFIIASLVRHVSFQCGTSAKSPGVMPED